MFTNETHPFSFFVLLLLIVLAVPLSGQQPPASYPFDNTPPVLDNSQLTGRAFHITVRDGYSFMRQVENEVWPSMNYDLTDTDEIWVIDDGPRQYTAFYDDGNRFFGIRNANSGLYLTVGNEADGAELLFLPRYAADDPNYQKQQFAINAATSFGFGWYRLKSRVGNFILQLTSSGISIVDAPVAANRTQVFSFRLALPYDPDQDYIITPRLSHKYLSDQGRSDPVTGLIQTEVPDQSVFWHFISLGNDEFRIRNSLTGHYMSTNGESSYYSEIKTTYNPDRNTIWVIKRNAATFTFFSKETGLRMAIINGGEGSNLLQGDFLDTGWRMIVQEVPTDPSSPIGGDFNAMLDGAPAEPNDCFEYGSQFQLALLERVNLPLDVSFWPIVLDALRHYYGNNEDVKRSLENFNLTDPGHRAELQFAVRDYMLGYLPQLTDDDLNYVQLTALRYYEVQVREIRLLYANALQDAWTDFESSNLPSSGMVQFSTMLISLDAGDYNWPNTYPIETMAEAQAMADYANVNHQLNNTPENTNLQILFRVSTGIASIVSLAVSPYINIGLSTFFQSVLGSAVTNATPAIVATSGTILSVALVAAFAVAAEAQKVADVVKLRQRVEDKVTWAGQVVRVRNTMNSTDEIAKLQLLSDMDYLIAAQNYQFTNNDDDRSINLPLIGCNSPSLPIELDAEGNASLAINDVPYFLGGSCTAPFTNRSLSQTQFGVDDLGEAVVEVLASTDEGTTVRCSFTVTVVNGIAPVARCNFAPNVSISSDGVTELNPSAIGSASTDNVGIASYTLDQPSVDCALVGETVSAVLTVTDFVGNSSSCTGSFVVVDDMAPEAVCRHYDVPIGPNGTVSYPLAALYQGSTDNCGIQSISVATPPLVSSSLSLTFNCDNIGSNAIMITLTDAANNSSSCEATVRIIVDTPPIPDVTELPDIFFDCGGGTITGFPTATDACGEVVSGTPDRQITFAEVGNYLVRWQYEDDYGNRSGFQDQFIFVQDITAPVVTFVPDDITLCGAQEVFWDEPTAVDACGEAFQDDLTYYSGDFFEVGITTIPLSFIDDPGNRTDTSFLVTILAPDDAGNCALLPVELLDFSGARVGKTVQLKWETTNESDNRGFGVEHSPNGQYWSALGFRSARADGGGVYAYLHTSPAGGANYYRIRQIDHDGEETLYGPLLVQMPLSEETLTLFPNPTRNRINIGGVTITENTEISLTDLAGREVLHARGQALLELNDLPSGTYLVLVKTEEDKYCKRLVISR